LRALIIHAPVFAPHSGLLHKTFSSFVIFNTAISGKFMRERIATVAETVHPGKKQFEV
jgi:hypothetical protein